MSAGSAVLRIDFVMDGNPYARGGNQQVQEGPSHLHYFDPGT